MKRKQQTTPRSLVAFIVLAMAGVAAGESERTKQPAGCAAGCSVAGPPVATISPVEIASCLEHLAGWKAGETSLALETLLFHAGEVIPYVRSHGLGTLETGQAAFLKKELARDEARIVLRIIDAEGVERLRMDRRVPIGEKQHLHPGDAVGFHPPEISFTIHRVGLHHLWSRL